MAPGGRYDDRKLVCSGRRYDDVSVREFKRELGPSRGDRYPYEEVDFSQNELTSVGLRPVLDLCRRCPNLRVLKLYKNQIDDEGADDLADLCARVPWIEEIHLSHNHFTAVGAEVLVTEVAKSRPDNAAPLWLRLERNDIAEPNAFWRRLQALNVSACQRLDETRCTTRHCCHHMKIHLPYITAQNTGRRAPPRDKSAGQSYEPPPRGPRGAYDEVSTRRSDGKSAPVQRATIPGMAPKNIAPPAKAGFAPGGKGAMAPPKGIAGSPALAKGGGPGIGAQARAAAAAAPAPAPWAFPVWSSLAAAKGALSNKDKESHGKGGSATKGPPQSDHSARKGRDADYEYAAEEAAPRQRQPEKPVKQEAFFCKPVSQDHSTRPSLVLDELGRRRVLPQQLDPDCGAGDMVCTLCDFVSLKPVITTCSHIFCHQCFQKWVADQVNKQKSNKVAEGPVPLIPCPECSTKLRKKDIILLEKENSTGSAVQLLKRMRNNLQVRCVHHADLFRLPSGIDAERVQRKTGLICEWIGDFTAYEDHVRKNCLVEQHIVNSRFNGPDNAEEQANGDDSGALAEAGEKDEAAAEEAAEEAAQADGEVRVARYDYNPGGTDKAQIVLKANDCVKIFELTESGWAAGIRLDRDTGEEIGEAGWFPSGYLFPVAS